MRFDAGVFWHLLFSDAFLRPAWITVWVTFAAMTIGIVLGLVGGLAAASSLRAVRVAVRCYVVVFRGLPTLVQIVFWYDALAELTGNWINLPALAAGVLALGVNEGAYMTEIVRAGLGAVEHGQREAARSLGLSVWQVQRLVVIPQAIRPAIPPTVGFLVHLVKNTALASVIGFLELTRAGQIVANVTFQPLPVFLTVGAGYFILCYPLSLASRALERRLGTARLHLAYEQGGLE